VIGEIAKQGDRLKTLEALRDRLAEEIDKGPEPRDLAALSSRLEKVLAEIDGLGGVEGDAVDEIKAQRVKRLAGTGTEGS
jgi:hypothetical protein